MYLRGFLIYYVVISLLTPHICWSQDESNHTMGQLKATSNDLCREHLKNEQISSMVEKLLLAVAINDPSDLEFVRSAATSLGSAYDKLEELIFSGPYCQLSHSSHREDRWISVESFFTAVFEIQQQLKRLEASRKNLVSIQRQMLPSQRQARHATQLPRIDWTLFSASYKLRLDQILTIANNYSFQVYFRTGHRETIPPDSGRALSWIFQEPIYDSGELAKLRLSIVEKGRSLVALKRLAQDQARTLTRLILGFIADFGDKPVGPLFGPKGKGFRTGGAMDGNAGSGVDDYSLRSDAYEQISQLFWQRSYLRVKYEYQLGAIQPKQFDPSWQSLGPDDVVKRALLGIRQGLAISETELGEAEANAHQILDVFGVNFSDESGLATALWLGHDSRIWQFKRVEISSREVISMMFRLVLGDIKEERLLRQSSSAPGTLVTYYQSRYKGTPEDGAKYSKLKCLMDRIDTSGLDECQRLLSSESSSDPMDLEGKAVVTTQPMNDLFDQMNLLLKINVQSLAEAAEIREKIKLAEAMSVKGNARMKRLQDL